MARLVMAMTVMTDEMATCTAQLAAAALTQCESMKRCWLALTLRRHLLAASLIFGIEVSLDVVKRESFIDQLSGGAPVF